MSFCLLRVSFAVWLLNVRQGLPTRAGYTRDSNEQSFRRRRIFVLAFNIVSSSTYIISHIAFTPDFVDQAIDLFIHGVLSFQVRRLILYVSSVSGGRSGLIGIE